MIAKFLGTGTSQGVPVIGCRCAACTSKNPKDCRLRCSLYIHYKGKSFIIDVGPDFRQQMLTNLINNLDFVLITHEHNDHTAGLDDIRPINFMSGSHIDVYTLPRVIKDLKTRFAYVFAPNPYPGAPKINLIPFHGDRPLNIQGVEIIPINISHGNLPILGFRIDKMAYCTDTSQIADEELWKLSGLDVLIISALRVEPHYSHYTINQALALVDKVKPQKAYLIHMSHLLGPVEEWEKDLPPNIYAAYDGLEITIE